MGETLFEIVWYVALLAGPIGLLFTSWRRYLRLPQADRAPMLLARIALGLLSFLSTIWVSFYAVVSTTHNGPMGRWIGNLVTTNFVAYNAVLSAVLLITSFLVRPPVRSPLLLASAFLLAIWILASLVH